MKGLEKKQQASSSNNNNYSLPRIIQNSTKKRKNKYMRSEIEYRLRWQDGRRRGARKKGSKKNNKKE